MVGRVRSCGIRIRMGRDECALCTKANALNRPEQALRDTLRAQTIETGWFCLRAGKGRR